MGFLRRLFGGGAQSSDDRGLHLYIKCQRCGSPVHVRIDLHNDLSAEYGDTEAEGYHLIKEVMDDRCFRLMRAELQFDARRREVSRAIEGGTLISQEEFEALREARGGRPT
ncbi:MAG TPA: hypothetical protein VFZ66_09645 [Herpetosiphonaceae bacterium]